MLHVTSALEDESMRRRLWIGLIVGGLSGFGLSSALQSPAAVA
jgi:hypothetical protein